MITVMKLDFVELLLRLYQLSNDDSSTLLLYRNITDNGRTELEVYNRAKKAAAATQTPLMVHHTNSTIELASSETSNISCPGSLRKGDIYTHTFHGHESSIYNPEEKSIYQSVIR